jgi:uncharacterized SAM-binding protein YcdF (DUF218 family)
MTAASEHDLLRAPKSRSCVLLRRCVPALLAVIVLLGAAAWWSREPLLRSAAELWIVSDLPAPADAVAVFGGGIENRPFAAAEYYKQGLVGKILLPGIGSSRAERLGILESHVEINRRVLLKLGVPATAIEIFGSDLSNTQQEALALREWAVRTGARSIIVPSEIFSARRLRWMLHRVFKNEVVVRVPALEPQEYRRDDWWKHESGLIGFQNEVIKYVYYRFKY